jgi:predicted outer membrane lipoprotein
MNDMFVVLILVLLFAPVGLWLEYQEYRARKREDARNAKK